MDEQCKISIDECMFGHYIIVAASMYPSWMVMASYMASRMVLRFGRSNIFELMQVDHPSGRHEV